jgi:hypothetical protein
VQLPRLPILKRWQAMRLPCNLPDGLIPGMLRSWNGWFTRPICTIQLWPRATGDLDLWVNPTSENAGRILRALQEFGIGGIELSAADFVKPDHIVQLGVPPVRLELVTAIDGVHWAEAWQGKLDGDYGSVPTRYLG